MTRVSTSAEALGDFAIHANHRSAPKCVNVLSGHDEFMKSPEKVELFFARWRKLA
jgi:hypothetical protein